MVRCRFSLMCNIIMQVNQIAVLVLFIHGVVSFPERERENVILSAAVSR